MRINHKCRGYTLIEIVITIGVIAILATGVGFSLLQFRNNMEYDNLLNNIVKTINYSKLKSATLKLDSTNSRNSYGIKFLSDSYTEFEGSEYSETSESNIVNEVPVGFSLSTTCSPNENGTIVFSPLTSENSNECTVDIYRLGENEPTGSIIISKYGVIQAS